MAQPLITVNNLHFDYRADSDQPIVALRGVSMSVRAGERLAIVGRNGSGKSTLAKCLNGLLLPSQGSVNVLGMDTSAPARAFDIRAKVGIVLQNPDNQFVATTVEEEIVFGPENLGIPRDELVQRVEDALATTGLADRRHREPRTLSAGAKARLAVASILAMRPDCLILDESTALLDPLARQEMLALLTKLHASGLTIIAITHFMDEAALADRVVVMRMGEIVAEGSPRKVLTDAQALARWGLNPPAPTRIAQGLRDRGVNLPSDVLTMDELGTQIGPADVQTGRSSGARYLDYPSTNASPDDQPRWSVAHPDPSKNNAISIRSLSHTYLPETPLAQPALHDASLAVSTGTIHALVGPSDAGKSTLTHYINGLERPAEPSVVTILGQDTADAAVTSASLVHQVSLVLQDAHHQLIERYVGDDVAFGPRQTGLHKPELRERVQWAMDAVGLDFDLYVDRPTFGLSGGEMRRVALAGALAVQPRLLVLDEATTGLDPEGRDMIHDLLRRLVVEEGVTVLLVSNDMDEVAMLADAVTVLSDGQTVASGSTHDVLGNPTLLRSCGLVPPETVSLAKRLGASGITLDPLPLTADEAEEALWQALSH